MKDEAVFIRETVADLDEAGDDEDERHRDTLFGDDEPAETPSKKKTAKKKVKKKTRKKVSKKKVKKKTKRTTRKRGT